MSASPSQTDLEFADDDFEQQSVVEEDVEEEAEAEPRPSTPPTRSYDPNAALGNLQWDEDLTPGPSSSVGGDYGARTAFLHPRPRPIQVRQVTDETIRPSPHNEARAREDTPLLHKATSLTFAEPRRPAPTADGVSAPIAMPVEGPPTTLTRRVSQASTRSGLAVRRGSTASRVTKAVQAGQSTFGQTVRKTGHDVCVHSV